MTCGSFVPRVFKSGRMPVWRQIQPVTIAGTVHVNDLAAMNARADFLKAYAALEDDLLTPCTQTISTAAFTGNVPVLGPLPPGVYCFAAAATFTDTTLTLDGSTNPSGIWIFKVGELSRAVGSSGHGQRRAGL